MKLKLITTETFNAVPCDFYRNMNDDMLLTREQIGQALEYKDPSKAIYKIHLKHKDRLEPLCIRLKLDNNQNGANLSKSEEQERVYYSNEELLNYANVLDNQRRINSWIGHGISLNHTETILFHHRI